MLDLLLRQGRSALTRLSELVTLGPEESGLLPGQRAHLDQLRCEVEYSNPTHWKKTVIDDRPNSKKTEFELRSGSRTYSIGEDFTRLSEAHVPFHRRFILVRDGDRLLLHMPDSKIAWGLFHRLDNRIQHEGASFSPDLREKFS